MNNKVWIWFIIIAFIVGAIGSIVIGRFVLPPLSNIRGFSWVRSITTNAPIVINRTEEVQLNEGVNLVDLIKRSGNITVGIWGPNSTFLGNGVIMTSDGLIFTSAALIGNQTQLTVVINDGHSYPATIKGKEKNGLVALTIASSGLPSAQFNNAADLTAGQRVIYLGRSNVQFEHEAIAGLVTQSLKNQITNPKILTDANFSVDYFGGPIINLSGNVVGLVINNSENIIAEDLQKLLNQYLTK